MLNKRGGIESDLTVSVLESGDGGPCDPTFQVSSPLILVRPERSSGPPGAVRLIPGSGLLVPKLWPSGVS